MLSNIYLHTSNPFNIRFSKRNQWKGQVGSYKGFCIFESDKYAIRAFLILCHVYKVKYKVHTINEFIARFAPPSENNTERYVLQVTSYLRSYRHFSDILYDDINYMYDLAYIIAKIETGKELEIFDFANIYKTIKI